MARSRLSLALVPLCYALLLVAARHVRADDTATAADEDVTGQLGANGEPDRGAHSEPLAVTEDTSQAMLEAERKWEKGVDSGDTRYEAHSLPRSITHSLALTSLSA